MEQKHLRSSLMGFTLGLPKKLVPNRMTHHEIYIQDTPESILKTSKDMVSMQSLWIMTQTKSETVTWTWFKVTEWWFQFIEKIFGHLYVTYSTFALTPGSGPATSRGVTGTGEVDSPQLTHHVRHDVKQREAVIRFILCSFLTYIKSYPVSCSITPSNNIIGVIYIWHIYNYINMVI